MKNYFWRILIAIDQLFNAILGGDEDETISSRCGKLAQKGQDGYARVIDFFLGEGHCKASIEEDERL
jgi:hypothetical protein